MAMKMCLYFICNFRILFSTSADTFIQRNLQGIPTWVIEQQVGVRASCSSPYHLVCVCLKDNRYVCLTLTSEQFEPFPLKSPSVHSVLKMAASGFRMKLEQVWSVECLLGCVLPGR